MSHHLALTYDNDDHVTRVVDGASTTEFAFDAAGRRVSVTAGGENKRFLQAPNGGDGYESPQAVTDATGALIASYVFAGETPLAKSTPTDTQYYLTDALGSVIATSSDTGTLVSTLEYDAFGNERTSGALASDTHGDFRLHGMWKDPSGLYYVRARVYDAETGRFTSRDPADGVVSIPETRAPYVLAWHNPLEHSDPTGTTVVGAVAIGPALGALAATAIISTIKVVTYVATAAIVACAATYGYTAILEANGATIPPGPCNKGNTPIVFHYTEYPPSSFDRGVYSGTWWTEEGTLSAASAQQLLGLAKPGASRLPPEHVLITPRDNNFRRGPMLPTGLAQWYNVKPVPRSRVVIRRLQ
jgi:RHS repeat-associated protein